MHRKYLIIILLMVAYTAMIAGCASKQLTKSESSSPAQNVSSGAQQNDNEKTVSLGGNQNVNDKTTNYKNSQSQSVRTSSIGQKEKIGLQDTYFAFDSSAIEPQYRNILKKNADYLMANKNIKVTIEGHCDERGTAEYNMALGQHRADEVKKYLVNLGVAGKAMTTVSYGKEKPIDPGHNEEAWAKNRRAHFEVN
jgi:peptidoglycan-associated lipoprotein